MAAVSGLAQGTLSTLLTNGPVSNRVNVVVLSEGYTSSQLGQFLVDATNLVNTLLGTMPYQEYRSYFNAYAISVASAEAGSDHPYYGFYANTYFNSAYENNARNYLITIPADASGQGKVDLLVTNLTPQADVVMLLVNDTTVGGSSGLGGPNGTTNRKPILTARNYYPYDDIPAHESGHYFGGLVDEYTNAVPGYVPIEAPNSTQQTNRSQIKWAAWIEPTTPIPTPYSYDYAGVVGLFQGAQYQTTNWYRPKFDCKMQHLGVDFCEVCSEQLVKTIYQNVRPLDGFSPAASNLNVFSTQAVSFAVTPLQPQSHSLSAQWSTNGVAVSGATNMLFQLWPRQLGNGTHAVRVVVRDLTPLVRSAPTNFLSATNTWSVNVSLNELQLLAPLYLAGGRFRFTVTGSAPQGFVVQASTNFSQWVRLSTNALTGGKFEFTNAGLGSVPFRYYRALAPP